MIRRFSVATGDSRGPLHVEADAPIDAQISRVLEALRLPDTPWYVGSRQIELSGPFSQLHNGDLLTPRPLPPKRQGDVELRVTAGPATGARAAISDQAVVIGRGEGSSLLIPDVSVSRKHASVRTNGQSYEICDHRSSNGTRVNGTLLEAETWRQLESGDSIEVGDTVLRIAAVPAANGELTALPDGRVQFNLRPRRMVSSSPVQLKMPAAPEEADDFTSNMALASSMTTAAGTVVAALVIGRPEFMLIGLLAPVQYVVVNRIQRRKTRAKRSASLAKHEALRSKQLLARRAADADELAATASAYPTVDEVVDICAGPTSRLWERHPEDDHFAAARIGAVDRRGQSYLKEGDNPPEHAKLPKQPIVVSFKRTPVVGLVGHRPSALAVARWMTLQLAALHSPTRLQMALVCPHSAAADWSWMQWLPHVWENGVARIATDDTATQAVFESLVGVINDRIAELAHSGGGMPPPDTVLVIDGVARFPGSVALDRILEQGPLVGIVTLCIDATLERLRSQINENEVITVSDEATVMVGTPDPEGERSVAELLDSETAEAAARGMAPLEPATGARGGANLPFPVMFDELLSPDSLEASALASGWTKQPASTTFTFAATEKGPLSLDLIADGPHFLVVGTSGAGKSEAIQSILASLAAKNRPDHLNFALVDFKGGACYGAALDLPHTTAKIINLSGADGVNRALASIDAERLWRQQRFTEVSPKANSIDEYNARRSSAQAVIPRLVVVIDEYAVFVAEAKGATERVTKIAQVGRSLGMHLLIGTQSPRGVVDHAIKTNIQTKICLRTTDTTESNLVVDSPLPARIPGSLRGRGYALTPNGQLTAFQAAWVGAPIQSDSPEIQVRYLEFDHLAYEPSSEADPTNVRQAISTKRFDVLGVEIGRAWSQFSESQHPLRTPILPALETDVSLYELGAAGQLITIGLEDCITTQEQPLLTIDPLAGRHTLIQGSSGMGRTTALRSIAAAAARCTYPTHVHVIDLGSKRLATLSNLANVGMVVTEADPSEVSDLLSELLDEARRRDDYLAATTAGRIDRLPTPTPAMLLLIDNWSSFVRYADVDRSVLQTLHELMAKGPSVGLTVVIGADHEFDITFSRSFPEKYLLYFADPNPYVRQGLEPHQIPSARIAGRAVRVATGNVVQFASTADAIDTSELPRQAVAPIRLSSLPSEVPLSTIAQARGAAFEVVLGVGGSGAKPIVVDIARSGGALLVSGQPKSGKSSLVEAVCLQLHARGVRMAFLGGKKSRLAERSELWSWVLSTPLSEVSETINAIAAHDGPIAIVLDDVRSEIVDDAAFARALNRRDRVVIVSAPWIQARDIRGSSPIAQLLKDSCLVAMLQPDPDGALRDFQVVIPRGLRLANITGRGLLFQDGEFMTFQAVRG